MQHYSMVRLPRHLQSFTMSATVPGAIFIRPPRPPERRLALLQYRRIAQKGRAHHHGVGVFQTKFTNITVCRLKMNIVYNAWQQMQRRLRRHFAKHPQLQRGAYYFSMANLFCCHKIRKGTGSCWQPS